MFGWHGTLPGGGEWGFTSRAPGVGAPPYDGFNLGGHVGDDLATVLSLSLIHISEPTRPY